MLHLEFYQMLPTSFGGTLKKSYNQQYTIKTNSLQSQNMFIDKSIQSFKIKKADKSSRQIQEIQRQSIKHIRTISTSLEDIFNELQDFEPSMLSPNASPINRKYKSGPSNKSGSKQELIELSFFKKAIQKAEKQDHAKKGSSVHYSTYMKPIHNVKQKIKEILEQQKKQKEIEEEHQRMQVEKMKKKSTKNYSTVSPKYNKYEEKKVQQKQAATNREMQRQLTQMQGVTFRPKINNNVEINESFDQRLISSENRKMIKEVEIIKDMLKDETHKPKINSHRQSESRVKSIWASPQASRKQSNRMESFNYFDSDNRMLERSKDEEKHSRVKATIEQMQFMIQKKLFQH